MSDNKITHENSNNEGLRREDFEKLPSKGDWSYQLKHKFIVSITVNLCKCGHDQAMTKQCQAEGK